MAVCEVVNDAARLKKVHSGGIWVATSEELVSTRFFLVFSGVPQAFYQRMKDVCRGLREHIGQLREGREKSKTIQNRFEMN